MGSSGTDLGARCVRQELKVDTVWVFGDQLSLQIGALATVRPGSARVLMIESASKLTAAPWHVQRAHFLITSMRRFASEVAALGFEVDYRQTVTFAEGLANHRAEFRPSRIVATEPNSHRARSLALGEDVVLVPSNQFLCHYDDFATWARSRKHLRLEDFYRRQRVRLDYLMNGDEPEGGRWNFDEENRQPPPRRGPYPWPSALTEPLDTLDHDVVAGLPPNCTGSPPTGLWATRRAAALRRLDHFIDHALPLFGPHEDAMVTDHFHLAHSMLSPYLNNGLLLPREVADRVEAAYRGGAVPLASAEGFIRQLIGWREYVWGLYWLEGPSYASMNELAATRPLPMAFTGAAETRMGCVKACLDGIEERSWLHHIQRLMVLGNLSLLAGIHPQEVTSWMWERFVDGAEWVMVPNVIGMSLYADGGRMATKPYAAGGAYLSKMSTYCKSCSFDHKKRVGEDACPFTTLYWDFILRHADRFEGNHRMVRQVRAAERLSDRSAVRRRAMAVLALLDEGRL